MDFKFEITLHLNTIEVKSFILKNTIIWVLSRVALSMFKFFNFKNIL